MVLISENVPINFELTPGNMDFNFEQVCFILFKISDDKISQVHRDPGLNYFDQANSENQGNVFK